MGKEDDPFLLGASLFFRGELLNLRGGFPSQIWMGPGRTENQMWKVDIKSNLWVNNGKKHLFWGDNFFTYTWNASFVPIFFEATENP